jgi:signal transduction histidine kinase
MNEMIDSFLFWSRIRKNELDFNPIRINVKNLILENINLLKGTANQKDVELRFDILDDAIAFADEVMITTVLRNLIYNAIKFTSRGGQVFTKVDIDADFVKISVEDTGVGISENDIEKLFDKDAKIASRGTENEIGSGLGLLLCKDYVEKNGGEISIESEEGKGSIFRFSIPHWKSISKN